MADDATVRPAGEIDALLDENRTFPPPEPFRRTARASDPAIYEKAAADPEGFWASHARELRWSTPFDQVVAGTGPEARWFPGGHLNASVNCLDRHIESAARNKAALLWEGEPGDRRTWTYFELWREVK
jgi:acetyl-CoA synthetase